MIERASIQHKILQHLCAMPRPVRGASEVMLNRHFGDPGAIHDLARLGLIRERGWATGPGTVWVPTPEGEALCADMAGAGTSDQAATDF